MGSPVQISTFVSETTKELLDRRVRALGVTRAHLIEEALLHHLKAIAEIPPEAIVPARIVLSARSAAQVARLIERPPKPTAEMRKLFADRIQRRKRQSP